VLRAEPALPVLDLPRRHHVVEGADVDPRYLEKILLRTYDRAPADFEALLGIEGVGAKTVRALALAAELIHGTPASTRDPARFSFAHGGKDGHPFPVDIATYEGTIEYLRRALDRTRIDHSDKVAALKRLAAFPPPPRAATVVSARGAPRACVPAPPVRAGRGAAPQCAEGTCAPAGRRGRAHRKGPARPGPQR
jgi:hypothetical protein